MTVAVTACAGHNSKDNSTVIDLSSSTEEALRPREGKKLLQVTW